jgi:hypothetical protein
LGIFSCRDDVVDSALLFGDKIGIRLFGPIDVLLLESGVGLDTSGLVYIFG